MIYCKICGQDNEADHSKCHRIAMERLEPCEHDNTHITLSGLWQCMECGAILDESPMKKYNQPLNHERDEIGSGS